MRHNDTEKYQILPSSSRYALLLLLSVNLLNYIDRQVLYAVFPLVKEDFHLSDTALGFLGSAFMICYMVSAPFLGWLGDRMSRVKLAAGGLAVWSCATGGAFFVTAYPALFIARTTVGIGEASFGTVSPGLLTDYYPQETRGRVLSYFFLAIPVGSALGYLLGGVLGQAFGWHAAFLLAGVPGLLLTIPLWLLREPVRGGSEEASRNPAAGSGNSYRSLISNRSFVMNTLAMAAMTFALGGLAQWVPTFLYREYGLDIAKANTIFGGITVLAGISGTLAGGWLGDLFQKKHNKGYLMVSGWGFLLGAPVTALALFTNSLFGCSAAMFFAEFFLFLNTGPLNTVIVNVTRPGIRAMAFAVNIFFIHALGDAVSPSVLGSISDLHGLKAALMVTPGVILLAAVFCFVCTRFIEKDSANVNQQPANAPSLPGKGKEREVK
ncbi:MAG TPA: MFS transporter [Nitrospirota bacterium]|nr:MFS transporter [Nitrospirota bacterium]